MITLTDGRFGEAVGAILRRTMGAHEVRLGSAITGFSEKFSPGDFLAVASWRRNDKELDELDAACFAAGVSWCGVYPTEDRLLCGPLVLPGHGPCFRCFRRRYLCHHSSPEREACLQRAYDRDPGLGAAGFMAPMAWAAASMLVAASAMGAQDGGRLREISLFDAGFLDSRVVAVHNCSRCRPSVQTRNGDRFVSRLVKSLDGMLP